MIKDSEGFWFSYIDVILALVAVFLLLYLSTATQNDKLKKKYDKKINMQKKYDELQKKIGKMQGKLDDYALASKEIKQFSDAWRMAEKEFIKHEARPYVDLKSGGWRLEIAENILFNSESAVLSEDGINRIEQIGKILKGFIQSSELVKKTIRIVVGGHCDPRGSKSFNLELSDNRANNVAERLKSTLKDTRVFIETIGYGYRYLKPNAKNYREHRRITITVQPIAVDYLK